MAKNKNTESNDRYRNRLLADIMEFLKNKGEDCEQVASNCFAYPFVNDLGSEEFIKITIAVPTGSRDGEPYDMYALADEFKEKQKKQAEKQKQQAEQKAKKIEADKKKREIMAKGKERNAE